MKFSLLLALAALGCVSARLLADEPPPGFVSFDDTVWTSPVGSTIQFLHDGTWTEEWEHEYWVGTWKAEPDNAGVVITRADDHAYHYAFNDHHFLVRDFIDYAHGHRVRDTEAPVYQLSSGTQPVVAPERGRASLAGTTWTSIANDGGALSTVQFLADGTWKEDWGDQHNTGRWWENPRNNKAFVVRTDNLFFHYWLNGRGHLVRGQSGVTYERATASTTSPEGASSASTAPLVRAITRTSWTGDKKFRGTFSIISFTADGKYVERLGTDRKTGTWVATDDRHLTVNVDDGSVLKFTYYPSHNTLGRANGNVIYHASENAPQDATESTDGFGTPVPAPIPDHPAPTVTLPASQTRAVVLIKGDNAEGTGFLVKTKDGPVVFTNQHVIANNPNLKIVTSTGAELTILSYKGATDRDLAMIAIKDGPYDYLKLATDVTASVQPGDEVITPGNSQGGDVVLNTDGKILGLGPDRIEFDNPIYHGNSGGPVIHTKSGTVIGVVAMAMKVDTTDEVNKASFANRNSAIGSSMRYFGVRLDNVPGWDALDPRQFQAETAFLDAFDARTRALDCYLNAPDDDKPEDTAWKDDDKIVKACTDYFNQASGADTGQQMDALRQFCSDLHDLAKAGMATIGESSNFYHFDQQRAKDEIAYRKALQAELEKFDQNVSLLASLPRPNK